MRAQASVEYLLLSAVGIALVSLSVISLSGIKSAMDSGLEISRFRDSSQILHYSILEVCSFGSGNERKVDLSSPVSVSSEELADGSGYVVRYTGANSSRADFSPCRAEGGADSSAIVENEDGKIRVR